MKGFSNIVIIAIVLIALFLIGVNYLPTASIMPGTWQENCVEVGNCQLSCSPTFQNGQTNLLDCQQNQANVNSGAEMPYGYRCHSVSACASKPDPLMPSQTIWVSSFACDPQLKTITGCYSTSTTVPNEPPVPSNPLDVLFSALAGIWDSIISFFRNIFIG